MKPLKKIIIIELLERIVFMKHWNFACCTEKHNTDQKLKAQKPCPQIVPRGNSSTAEKYLLCTGSQWWEDFALIKLVHHRAQPAHTEEK